MTKHTINIVNDSKIMYINIDTTYQVALKHASTLTVFKDTRHGIYVTFFGMRLTRTRLAYFLTSDHWSAHSNENSVICQLVMIS